MSLQRIKDAMVEMAAAEVSLIQALEAYQEGKDTLFTSPIEVIGRAYVQLKSLNEVVEAARVEMNKEIEYLSKGKLPDLMEKREVPNITVEIDGKKFTLSRSSRTSVSMTGGQASIDYLKGSDNPNLRALVQETVNSNSLSAAAKELLETQGVELPDDLFKSNPSAYTSVRAKK